MSHNKKASAVDDLADVLAGMRHARRVASSKSEHRVLLTPKPIYPMALVASQLTVNPFEFFILIGLLVTGAAFATLGVNVPGSVASLLPLGWVYLWVANVALGSLGALLGGLYRRDPDKGLLIYQLGWGLCGLGCTVYGIAVLLKFPIVGFYPGLTNLLVATACAVRVVQVQRFFRLAELMRKGLLQVPHFVPQQGDDGDARHGPR